LTFSAQTSCRKSSKS